MSQREALQELDADIMAALLGAGMGDNAVYSHAGVATECEVYVDRAAQFFDDATDTVGRQITVTLFKAQVATPLRGAHVILDAGDMFELKTRVAEDESMQRWVVEEVANG